MATLTPRTMALGAAALAGAVAVSGAQAALIFHDAFDTSTNYSLGDLDNQTPGSVEVGSYTSGGWDASGGTSFGSPAARPGSLGYTSGSSSLVTSGDKVLARRTNTGSFYKAAVGEINGSSNTSGSVLYISGLMNLGDSSDGYFGLQIGPNGSKDTFGFGFNSAGNAVIVSENADTSAGGYDQAPTTRATSVSTSAAADTHFLVAKITNAGGAGSNDLVELFVNPDLTAEPGAPTLAANWGTTVWFPSDDLSYLSFNANLNGGASSIGTAWDEIRVGSTWDDVTPFVTAPTDDPPAAPAVPEPASAALAALAGMTLLRRRR